MEIDPLVPMKIFEGFLPYMGMVAVLVMCPRCHEQTLIPPSHGGTKFGVDWPCIIVIEEKMFEIATESWVYD